MGNQQVRYICLLNMKGDNMRTKWTEEKIINFVEENNYKFIKFIKFNKLKSRILIKCDKGHIYETCFDNFKQGCRCGDCANNKNYSYEYVKNYIENLGYKLISKEYKNMRDKITVQCDKGHVYETSFRSIKRGCKCKKCSDIKNAEKRKHSYEYVKDYIENLNYKLISKEYDNCHEKLKIQCNEGHIFFMSFAKLVSGRRCPYCNKSKGEEKIITYLEKYNITYERQKTYPSLKGEGGCNLSYDFYLLEYNCCIEYQGEQHYKPIDYFGGKEKFEIQLIHDIKKKDYCTRNNIRLITIPYWEFDNIDKILNKQIYKLQRLAEN